MKGFLITLFFLLCPVYSFGQYSEVDSLGTDMPNGTSKIYNFNYDYGLVNVTLWEMAGSGAAVSLEAGQIIYQNRLRPVDTIWVALPYKDKEGVNAVGTYSAISDTTVLLLYKPAIKLFKISVGDADTVYYGLEGIRWSK